MSKSINSWGIGAIVLLKKWEYLLGDLGPSQAYFPAPINWGFQMVNEYLEQERLGNTYK